MLQELLAFCLPVIKFIVAAALMVVFYKLLYKEKTTFNRCRMYLISIAFVSLLISQFNIQVYTKPATIVEIEAAPPIVSFSTMDAKVVAEPTAVVVADVTPTLLNRIKTVLTFKNILFGTYILVTVTLLITLIIQLLSILAAKRKGKIMQLDGYEMVVSPSIPTPFSFFKSIYIGENLNGTKRDMILKHEQWHIKHHHYLDVLVMEVLVRIFWFNPVLWWVRKELRNVSEFQADRSVLDEGHDLYKYQTIILEEVMEHNPYLANGFNNSFTKKRFIMMKNKYQIRMTTLRRVLLLPFLAGVFSLLSLSVGKSQVKYVTKTTNGNVTVTKTVEKESEHSPNSTTTIDSFFNAGNNNTTKINVTMDKAYSSEDDVDKAINDISKGLGQAVVELNKLAANPNVAYRKASILKVFFALDVKASNTKVDSFPFSDEFIASFTQEDFKKSAQNYSKIKTNIDELKKEESSSAKALGLNQQMMLLIQDPFMSKVLNEMLTQAMSTAFSALGGMMGTDEGQASMKEGMSGMLGNMTGLLKNMSGSLGAMTGTPIDSTGSNSINTMDADQAKRDEEFAKNSYKLKSEQIKILDMPYSEEISIYSIEKSKVETKITLAIPVKFEGYWIRFAKGFRIIDQQSKDTYLIRKLDKDIPLSKFIITSGISNKTIAVTMIFPPLKDSVKRINIIEILDLKEVLPNNSTGAWQFKNVNLEDYLVDGSYSPKVYK